MLQMSSRSCLSCLWYWDITCTCWRYEFLINFHVFDWISQITITQVALDQLLKDLLAELFLGRNSWVQQTPLKTNEGQSKTTMNEHVFPLENGDFPGSHVSFPGFHRVPWTNGSFTPTQRTLQKAEAKRGATPLLLQELLVTRCWDASKSLGLAESEVFTVFFVCMGGWFWQNQDNKIPRRCTKT